MNKDLHEIIEKASKLKIIDGAINSIMNSNNNEIRVTLSEIKTQLVNEIVEDYRTFNKSSKTGSASAKSKPKPINK